MRNDIGMTFLARSFSIAVLFALAGCDGASSPSDGGSDVPPVDAPASIDTAAALDAAAPDAPATDAPAVADAPIDAALLADAPLADVPSPAEDAGSAPDAGACEYTGLDEVLVRCAGEYTFVRRIGVVPTTAECPDYYAVDGSDTRYASTDEAIAGESCDGGCRWRYGTAVSRLRCGRREGYEVLRATTPGCPDVYLFSDGFYPSVEAYDASHPCP